MEKYISSQVRYWETQKAKLEEPEKKNKRAYITISREYGCSGFDVATKIAEKLNEKNPEPSWAPYDKNIISSVMDDMGLSRNLEETLTANAMKSLSGLLQNALGELPPQVAVYRQMAQTVGLLALNGHSIIVGRAGRRITRNISGGFHVRLYAPHSWKVNTVMEKRSIDKKEAEAIVDSKTKLRDSYLKDFVHFDSTDQNNYDLLINTASFSVDEIASLIIEAMNAKDLFEV